MNINLTGAEYEELFQEIDVDKSGTIDIEELIVFLTK